MQGNRRDFLKTVLAGGALLGLNASPLKSFAAKKEYEKLTILHTNDTHSHIDPFPATDPKYAGMGGFARRAAMIKEIRSVEKNVLLLDAGDIFQGTPYFNMFNGEIELKLMSQIGYDAATIGNHEFDNGLDGIVSAMKFANFPFISSNYDFSKTVLADKTLNYKIFFRNEIKIGVFGLGVAIDGLVSTANYGDTIYLDPYAKAAEMAHLLKKDLHCDLVICLSHMGFSYKDDKTPSDVLLAKQSKNIDLIIGGHTHTFINKPYKFSNSDKKDIYICQVGWAGLKLGRLDFYFDKKTNKKFVDAHTIKVFNKQV